MANTALRPLDTPHTTISGELLDGLVEARALPRPMGPLGGGLHPDSARVDYGVWGGKSERERRTLKRRNSRADLAARTQQ